MQASKEDEKQHEAKTSSWVQVIAKTQKKVDEAEKWIEFTKKGKAKETSTPTPTFINMTIEEEQQGCTHASHVRIISLKRPR